jgi:hypothetical protein
MNASPTTHSPTVPTAPIFTLGSALRWLGHDCPDRRCSQPIDALPASMWFLRHGHPYFPTYPLETVLVVDLTETGEPLARIHRLIDEVNRCTRGETIRVRHGHTALGGQPRATRMPNLSGQNRQPGSPRGVALLLLSPSASPEASLAVRR